jgi:hypothetical protein
MERRKITTQAVALMRWRHANLVDPELRARFVWMAIVDSRYKANNQTVVNRDNEMLAGIAKERIGHAWIDRIIKDTRRNIHQNARFSAAEYLDFDGHWTVSLLQSSRAQE